MIYSQNSIILAPLSGFTDIPYRNSAWRHGCKFAFTEMIDASSLAYGSKRTDIMLKRSPADKWLGVQLVGCHADRIAKAVDILNQHQFDLLDFNLGCPAPKVARKGAGAILGQNSDKAAQLMALIAKKSKFPVTAKIRIQAEEDPKPTILLVKKLIDAGAQAITIHGRIRKRFYAGNVHYQIIAAVRESCDIQIIGNGNVMNLLSYNEMHEKSGCDVVMVARGAMGNPWLFNELNAPATYIPPTVSELLTELQLHVLEMVDFYGEELAMKVSRKIILDYLKGRGFNGTLKSQVSFLKTVDNFNEFMKQVAETLPGERYWTWLKSFPNAERRLQA
jgi:tRNA-dihydrouridine synthase B